MVGDEEGGGGVCVYYSHVHYDAGVDFPVGEDAFGCFLRNGRLVFFASSQDMYGGKKKKKDDTHWLLCLVCSLLLLQSRFGVGLLASFVLLL